MKNEKKRQKVFFERQKYARKMKFNDKGGSKDGHPKTSLDLVSLEMANLTAEQFQNKGGVKPKPKPLGQGNMAKPSYRNNLPRRHHVELPSGSPPTPSMLQLEGDIVSSGLDVHNKFDSVFSDAKALRQHSRFHHHVANKPTYNQPASATRQPTVAINHQAGPSTQQIQDKPAERRESSEDVFFQFTTSSTRPTDAAPFIPQVTSAPPVRPAVSNPLVSQRGDTTSSAEMSVSSASSDDEDDSPVFSKGYDSSQKHRHPAAKVQRSVSAHSDRTRSHRHGPSDHNSLKMRGSSLASFRNLIQAEQTGGRQGPSPQTRMDHGPSSSQLVGHATHQPIMYHEQYGIHMHQRSHHHERNVGGTVSSDQEAQTTMDYSQPVTGAMAAPPGSQHHRMDRGQYGLEQVTQCFTPVSSSGALNTTTDPLSHGKTRRRLEYSNFGYHSHMESIPRLDVNSENFLRQQSECISSVGSSTPRCQEYSSPMVCGKQGWGEAGRDRKERGWSAEGSYTNRKGPQQHVWSGMETIDLTCHETTNFTSPESSSGATHPYQPVQDDQDDRTHQHKRRTGSVLHDKRTPEISDEESVSSSYRGFPSQVLKELLQLDADLNRHGHGISDNEAPFKRLKRGTESFIESFHTSAEKCRTLSPIKAVPRTPEIRPSSASIVDVRETDNKSDGEIHKSPGHGTIISPFSQGVQKRALESISLFTPKKPKMDNKTPQTPQQSTHGADHAGDVNPPRPPAELHRGSDPGAGDIRGIEHCDGNSVFGGGSPVTAARWSAMVGNGESGPKSKASLFQMESPEVSIVGPGPGSIASKDCKFSGKQAASTLGTMKPMSDQQVLEQDVGQDIKSGNDGPSVGDRVHQMMIPSVSSRGIPCQMKPLIQNRTQCGRSAGSWQVAVGTQTDKTVTCHVGVQHEDDKLSPPPLVCDNSRYDIKYSCWEDKSPGVINVTEEQNCGNSHGDASCESSEVNPVGTGDVATRSCDHELVSSTVSIPTLMDAARASTIVSSGWSDQLDTPILPRERESERACPPSVDEQQGNVQRAENPTTANVTSSIALMESAAEGLEHAVDNTVKGDEAVTHKQHSIDEDKSVGTHMKRISEPKGSGSSSDMLSTVGMTSRDGTPGVKAGGGGRMMPPLGSDRGKVDDLEGADKTLVCMGMITEGISKGGAKETEDNKDTGIREVKGSEGDGDMTRMEVINAEGETYGEEGSEKVTKDAHDVERRCTENEDSNLAKMTVEVRGSTTQVMIPDSSDDSLGIQEQGQPDEDSKLECFGAQSKTSVQQGNSQSQEFSDSVEFVTQSTQTDTFDSCSSNCSM